MAPPTKKELITALQQSGDDLLTRVGNMDDDALDQGRYENGWNAKQILAHVASIEWTYKKLVDTAKQPRSTARPTGRGGPVRRAATRRQPHRRLQQPPGRPPRRQVREGAPPRVQGEPRRHHRRRPVLRRRRSSRSATRSAGGAQGTLAEVIMFVAVSHVQQHTRDLVGS